MVVAHFPLQPQFLCYRKWETLVFIANKSASGCNRNNQGPVCTARLRSPQFAMFELTNQTSNSSITFKTPVL